MRQFVASLAFFALASFAAGDLTLIAKRHDNRSDTFPDRPYGKDDVSYGVFLDLFDGMGAWRLGVTGSQDVGAEGVDGVVTPEIGLLAVDGLFEFGVSVLKDYMVGEEDNEWGDLYYQMHGAINVPLGSAVMVGVGAYYPFESWGDVFDFSTGDLDYAVTFRLRF